MPSYAFRVQGIEPKHDPAWQMAGPDVHRAYWQQVVKLVREIKDKELADGKDRFGEDLAPIAASTRARGRWRSHTGMGSADAPPLDPAYRLSRTRSLFAGRAKLDHAEFFWTRDEVTGLPWGRVLGWHRAGAGRLPVRDVIGLSPASLAQVKAKADAWWSHFKAGKAAEERAKVFQFVTPTAAPVAAKAPAAPISFKFATLGIGNEDLILKAAAEGKLSAPKKLGEPPQKPKPPGGGTPAPAPKPVPRPIVPKMAAMKPAPPPKPVVPKMAAPPKAAPPKPVVPKARPKPPPKPVQVIPPPGPKGEPIPPGPAAWQPRKQSEFRAFTNAKEMEQFGAESFGAWADGLSQGDKNAIRLYASDNYKWMNAILRGDPPAASDLPHGLSERGARDYIARTIAPLLRGKVDRDVVAYRGVRSLAAMKVDPAKLVPGQELTIEGFLSATLRKDKANDFAVGTVGAGPVDATRAILQVNTPEGSSGGYLNAAELSGYSDERELLMPPGVRLRFVRHGGVHKDVWGHETPILVFERVE